MVEQYTNIISKLLSDYPAFKVGMSVGLGAASFLFGGVYVDAMVAVSMLMLFDTITGMWASRMEGLAWTSPRFAKKIRQMILYSISISAAHFLDQTVPGEWMQFSAIGFVAANEFISILENIGRMGFKTPKSILNSLKEKYESK